MTKFDYKEINMSTYKNNKSTSRIRPAFYAVIILCIMSMVSCDVTDYLDVKPSKSLVVPSSVEDYQAILDYETHLNNNYSYLHKVASEDYYVTLNMWQSQDDVQRDVYIWNRTIDIGGFALLSDWRNLFIKVNYANIALEGLEEIGPRSSNDIEWNNAVGIALYFRAFAYFHIAQSYAPPYHSSTANTDLGIPLRTETDIETFTPRSSLAETYNKILEDLHRAEPLLLDLPLVKTRPSKHAARALLARVYQVMHNHEKALEYANATLAIRNNLLDYNNVNTISNVSNFDRFNDDVILHASTTSSSLFHRNAYVDTTLISSYNENDLRRSKYFVPVGNGFYHFLGNYTGASQPFAGVALDEVYLIKAESEARLGNFQSAMQTLNELLITRWVTGTFIPYTAASSSEAIEIILEERWKTLPFRGMRWIDLRRLNLEPEYAITLTRAFENGETFELPPNDSRYVLPIPLDEIRMTGIEQNPR